MKKIILTLLNTFLLMGCNQNISVSSVNSNEEIKTMFLPITNTFAHSVNNDRIYLKTIYDCNVFTYFDKEGNRQDFKYQDFNLDESSLIGGDALEIKYQGEWRTFDTFPAQFYLDGTIESVESHYCAIYEMILEKDEENITFKYVNENINLPFKQYFMIGENVISKDNKKIVLKNYQDYENGDKFYYTYNNKVEERFQANYLYDFYPR